MAVLYNKRTKEEVRTDNQKSRLSRMKRRIKAWVKAMEIFYDEEKHRMVMIGLTYSPDNEWKPKHVSNFMKDLRKLIDKNLLAYAWVAEMQMRGAVHYHIIAVVERGTDIPYPDEAGLWSYGSTTIETARSPWYLMTYVGKEYQKMNYPKGIRIFAVHIRNGLLSKTSLWRYRISTYPRWLYEILISNPWFQLCYPEKDEFTSGWFLTVDEEVGKRFGLEGYFEYVQTDWVYMGEGL